MKIARTVLPLIAMAAFAVTSYAPDFAILLGGSSDDSKAQAADHKDWIPIQSVSWNGAGRDASATGVAPPAEPSPPASAKGQARREFEPVVITVPVEGRSAKATKAFKKGNKLGTVRLRDGNRMLVLHGVTVASVTRTGASESISLNYTKIENAKVPDRAKERIKSQEQGRAP